MSNGNALIIFVKNPELGKVKTRLATSIGEQNALEIYKRLLFHTRNATNGLHLSKYLYYYSWIDDGDIWDDDKYEKRLQGEGDLGEKMENAFRETLENHDKVVIVGSDCPEINSSLIDQAFAELANNDIVIGPANDGGYYLLGMKTFYPQFFRDKKWSSSSVFKDTLSDVEDLSLSCALLPKLVDVDTMEDLMSTSFGDFVEEWSRTG